MDRTVCVAGHVGRPLYLPSSFLRPIFSTPNSAMRDLPPPHPTRPHFTPTTHPLPLSQSLPSLFVARCCVAVRPSLTCLCVAGWEVQAGTTSICWDDRKPFSYARMLPSPKPLHFVAATFGMGCVWRARSFCVEQRLRPGRLPARWAGLPVPGHVVVCVSPATASCLPLLSSLPAACLPSPFLACMSCIVSLFPEPTILCGVLCYAICILLQGQETGRTEQALFGQDRRRTGGQEVEQWCGVLLLWC